MVSVHGENFFINGAPTYQGLRCRGRSIEGLLLNSGINTDSRRMFFDMVREITGGVGGTLRERR
ncbi:MAG: hypothetical protein J7M38_11415 [Armatimonadetes bacterium]|nr:hypothetical protein [Armatimonadota bacterium]